MMNNENTVQVWDILIRIFHWSLVIFFTIAYFTAEEDNIWHIYSGYVVLGLIIFRVFWGLIGSKYARFSDFVYSPGNVVQYVKSLIDRNPKHYIGHTPAGGWVIVALLLSLLVVTVSGLKLYAVAEGQCPLAGVNNQVTLIHNVYADQNDDNKHQNGVKNEQQEFWEEIHEASTNFTLFLIFMHIAGVFVSSRLHNENLVKAMITGKKKA
jgi:cytochrome b